MCIKRPLLVMAVILIVIDCLYLRSALNKPCLLNNQVIDEYNKTYLEVTGRVTAVKENEYATNIYLDTGFVVSDNTKCKVIPGDVIRAYGGVRTFSSPRNDGEFNQRIYYLSIGIRYRMDSKSISTIRPAAWMQRTLNDVRTSIINKIEQISTDNDQWILKAMLLGDKTQMDRDYYELYQKNGIAHILAISGLHVSFIGMCIYSFLRGKGVSYVISFVVTSLILVMYAFISGNSFSGRRAIIMCVIRMGSELLGRRFDGLSALSLSSIVLITENPYVLLNSGYLLSFSTMAGIIVVVKPVTDYLNRGLASLKGRVRRLHSKRVYIRVKLLVTLVVAVVSSVLISMCSLPVIAYSYYQVPIMGALLNIIVIPLMSLVMGCALTGILLAYINPMLGTFFIGTVHFILRLYEVLCKLTLSLPGNTLITGQPTIVQITVYYLVLIMAVRIITRKKAYSRSGLVALLAVLVINVNNSVNKVNTINVLNILDIFNIITTEADRRDKLNIYMLDVGQGDGIVLQYKDMVILVDGGSTDIKNIANKRIAPFLKQKGIEEIDYCLISHTDADHISGVLGIYEEYSDELHIAKLVLPYVRDYEKYDNYVELIEAARAAGSDIEVARGGMFDISYNDLNMSCIHPLDNISYSDINSASAGYLLRFKDFSMVFTGDMDSLSEELILDYVSDGVSVVKAAHHGSDTSSGVGFVKECAAKAALISCGVNNRYGHPDGVVVKRFTEAGSRVYRTDMSGQISVIVDNFKFSIQTKLE